MIITIFGVITFQLVVWIAVVNKPFGEKSRGWRYIIRFPYQAIPTRHEVHGEPYLQGDMMETEPETKLPYIADMA